MVSLMQRFMATSSTNNTRKGVGEPIEGATGSGLELMVAEGGLQGGLTSRNPPGSSRSSGEIIQFFLRQRTQ